MVKLPEDGLKVRNVPSAGSLRKVANGLLLVRNSRYVPTTTTTTTTATAATTTTTTTTALPSWQDTGGDPVSTRWWIGPLITVAALAAAGGAGLVLWKKGVFQRR